MFLLWVKSMRFKRDTDRQISGGMTKVYRLLGGGEGGRGIERIEMLGKFFIRMTP